ncbi:MAG: DUF1214 domain-containing protein [Gammaproteobacteria bacterium]|nr:DUF1214 domain-containing protein [Gammaproteobacteria bacterium]
MTANNDIAELAAAWDRFCDDLKAAGRIPLREQVPPYSLDRAAGFQQIARNISLALQFNYEYKDPLFPELARYFDPTRKQGGDNSDCVYVGAQINGTDLYRISGDRGTSRYFSVVAVETGTTPWGGRVVSTLYGHELKTEVDGSFELLIGPDPQPGNWLRTTPGTFRVTIRQYFADWENERPLRAQIDRISGPALPPPQLSPAGLAQGLGDAGRWLQDSIEYWPAMLEKWKDYPNQFRSYWQLEKNRIDATPGGDPLVCYWQLPPDEALIIRVVPPQCVFWGVEFGNCWWETMDYRYRLSNTNMHYARLEDDGELIVVVAHTDPGLPNWLDCSGFAAGYITYRWMLSERQPIPQCTQIEFSALSDHVPATVRRITPAERREQLAARRRGVTRRFGY